MENSTRKCPHCQAMMDYRLGEYECPQCGKTVAREVKHEQARASGPGFRREAWHQPKAAAPATTSGPSPESKYDLGFDPDAPPPREQLSQLDWEKRVYFSITAVLAIIGALGDILGALLGHHGFSWLLSSLFWDAVGLFLLAFVLFSSELWAKSCCAILIVLELLTALIGYFVVVPYLTMYVGQSWMLPAIFKLPFWISLGIEFAWYGWLLSILWRDHRGSS